MESIVAVHPSKSNSLTYGFLHTRSMNPGRARERTTSKAVAQYVRMTLMRRDVKYARMISVSKSPNEDATGVAMLSMI